MSKILSAKYYQENKEKLEIKAHEGYQNLSKEEKEEKQQYGRECHKNLSQDEKQKFFGYSKTYCNYKKSILI